jgi:hypothetical protein
VGIGWVATIDAGDGGVDVVGFVVQDDLDDISGMSVVLQHDLGGRGREEEAEAVNKGGVIQKNTTIPPCRFLSIKNVE